MHRPAMTAKEADLDRAVRNSIQASLDHHTFLWWTFLSLIALANMAVWVWSYLTIDTTGAASCPSHHPYQRHHLHLSGVYVFVCAYRSFWPRIDLERYCLFDTFASSVALGRSAATVAEVSFAAQIALWLYHVGAIHGHAHLQHLALGLVPAIATAQAFCWCGVLTLNHWYHAIEESIWAVSAVCVGMAMASLAVYHPESMWYLGTLGSLACLVFFAFMACIDVPMYVKRWRENKESNPSINKKKFGYKESFGDALTTRVVVKSWDVWREESLWLTPYFSSAVWLSLCMVHIPPPAQ